MANGKQAETASSGKWTPTQAYVMAVICLVIGIAIGYLVRGSASPATAAMVASPGVPTAMPGAPGAGQVTPEQLKHMADTQAAPLLEKLKSTPNDPALLADLGNLYYDARQYPDAIDYYQRALTIQPANTNVRTDLGTAMWYLGDADKAIEQFKIALKDEPNKPNTLLNLGVVQWQGKMDVNGAIASWEKLLAKNPNYENKEQVKQMIAEARKHADMKPNTKPNKPAM
ncbi:MAG: tetratricopeptide repeat protein [Terriglobales bacterium]